MDILFLPFAELFKIQSNWFWEFISLTISFGLGIYFIWLCFRLLMKKIINNGLKQKIYFYSMAAFTSIFVLFGIVHFFLVMYIAGSKYTLNDFAFHSNELSQELVNIDIFDQNGNKVYTIVNDGVNREAVSLNEMPSYLSDAFVAVEDKNFYHHSGVSISGYFRAIFYKIIHPSMSMNGGSTLTQQLVKNVNGDMYNRNILHKYQEALLSIIIESKYSKKEILEMYLNRVFLGKGNIYGVGTAAKQYFGKSVSDLTLAESAYLAGLPQAPSSYTQNLELGNKRKNIVLNAMKENGFITESQWMRATAQTISFKNGDLKHSASLDAYVDYVLKEAKDDYGLSEEELKNKGYSIYTYLNTNLQNRMYEATQSFNFKDDKSSNKVQVGIAAVDNNTNKIIALNGGRNFVRGYLNHATAYYQPGSIIKPLAVYTPAFETGKWSPTSQVLDKKTDFDGYSPKNAENIYEGNITLERALIRSANIPAVEVLQDIGVNTGVETLKEMDFDIKQNDEGLHLALGGMDKGVTPIQMAQAYSTFPNLGYFEPAKAIKYIKDKKGNFIEKKDSAYTKGIDIYSPENAYKMTEILEKVISDPSGTGNNANIGRPVAGKTGTAEEAGTTGNRAAWFVGYTPEITMAVHLGFDNPSKSLYLTTPGGDEPARIFAKIMRNTLSGSPVRDFQKPIIQPEHKNALLSKVEDVKANFEAKKNEVASNWEKEKPLIRNFLDNVSNLIQNIVSFIQNLLNNHY